MSFELMALQSGISLPYRRFAGRRLIGFGILAAAIWLSAVSLVPVLLIPGPASADDSQVSDTTVQGNRLQRDAALPEHVREAVSAVKQQQPDIQFDPPKPTPIEPPRIRFSGLNLGWLPYIILAVIGIALVVVLLRYAGRRIAERKGAEAKVGPVTLTSTVLPTPGPERDRTFDEIDALAESGAFTEAVHRLLLLVQERLKSRIEHGIQVSLTSREILRRAKLPRDAATAFATLVAAVEVSLFGMRAANAATYALCREHSRRVLAAAAE